jgi:hypothetical protein
VQGTDKFFLLQVESRLLDTRSDLTSLQPNFQPSTEPLGLPAISNGNEVISGLTKATEELESLKSDPCAGTFTFIPFDNDSLLIFHILAEPFLAEISSLADRARISAERLSFLMNLEERVFAVAEMFSAYGLDSQFGRLHTEFKV